MSSKLVWNTVRPFISSKRTLSNDNSIIEAKNDITINVKGNKLVPIKTKNEI